MIGVTKDYLLTLLVHMPKDTRRKRMIDVNLEVMMREGVDVAEVKCLELPLSPTFLVDRVPGLDRRMYMQNYKGIHLPFFSLVDNMMYCFYSSPVICSNSTFKEGEFGFAISSVLNR
ncbi:hypothetical protein HanXRQr2_Chr02g0070441 [Helianthus annuus]|uniref:Uncharacterized protein n=1 Tax=Helianthus annuus TaxID=4232 RepID=A0A9K3JP84_HELAN|nr:hypothetical protein HanXRQr2_Chr02g0070441 [Helianthus annuus]KAJ0605046.1 hypothetical protein HanHA300_Chr02g0058571 [Helianthus annuus]KAJ0777513.1 hypothetical protein HanLR1_Chr02g0061321 [Helianthus annuus]